MGAATNSSHGQIGTSSVDWGTLVCEQLSEALVVQKGTGRLVGEMCVEWWRTDRLALAGGLEEQSEEVRGGLAAGDAATFHGRPVLPVAQTKCVRNSRLG